MHEFDPNPEQLKKSLCNGSIWHENSFTFIAAAMYSHRPSLYLYHNIIYHTDGRLHMKDYENLVDMACGYADDMGYPWMKTKLKQIV